MKGLDKPPAQSETQGHYYADWLELQALADLDGMSSASDAAQLLARADDDAPRDAEVLEGGTPTEQGDRRLLKITDALRLCKRRASIFGHAYPFQQSSAGSRRLTVRNGTEHPEEQRLYLFLLLCASGRWLERVNPRLNTEFERLSAICLRAYMPSRAAVHLFGTSSVAGEDRYTGTLVNKTRQLAADLCEQAGNALDDLHGSNTGDGGLDAVGWLDPLDDQPGRLVVFGQAAATPEWVTKQSSASYQNWNPNRIVLSVPNVTMCFIPYSFRNAHGGWYDRNDIQATILMDRLRILRVLQDDPAAFSRATDLVGAVMDEITEASEALPDEQNALKGQA